MLEFFRITWNANCHESWYTDAHMKNDRKEVPGARQIVIITLITMLMLKRTENQLG